VGVGVERLAGFFLCVWGWGGVGGRDVWGRGCSIKVHLESDHLASCELESASVVQMSSPYTTNLPS